MQVRVSHYPHTFEMECVCLGHTEMVTCIEVLSATGGDAGELILSGGADCTLRLWRMDDARLLHSLNLSGDDAADEDAALEGSAAPPTFCMH
jgi:WD40 repeat protein